jgi:hypothetical protein
MIRGGSKRRWAKGKKARSICDRSGFEHAYKDMVVEPGTGLLVYKRWSDGRWNLVDHPLNFPADASENIALKNPRSNTNEGSPAFLLDEELFILDVYGLPILVG